VVEFSGEDGWKPNRLFTERYWGIVDGDEGHGTLTGERREADGALEMPDLSSGGIKADQARNGNAVIGAARREIGAGDKYKLERAIRSGLGYRGECVAGSAFGSEKDLGDSAECPVNFKGNGDFLVGWDGFAVEYQVSADFGEFFASLPVQDA
jgi:hypothetical protein